MKGPVSGEEYRRSRTEGREFRRQSLLDEFSISEIWARERPETGCVSAETGSNPRRDPSWPYSHDWGYYPSGGLGLVLVILLSPGKSGIGADTRASLPAGRADGRPERSTSKQDACRRRWTLLREAHPDGAAEFGNFQRLAQLGAGQGYLPLEELAMRGHQDKRNPRFSVLDHAR